MLDRFRRIGTVGAGELTLEMRTAVLAVSTGSSLSDSLGALAHRLQVPALTRAIDHLVAAIDRGAPLALVLQAQAADAREEAKRGLIERAGRKEIYMLIPLKLGKHPSHEGSLSPSLPDRYVEPMTATPSLPPMGADAASRAACRGDIPKTALLHVALFILLVVVFFSAFIGLDIQRDDERLYRFGGFLWVPLPTLTFGMSIVVSVILLALRRRAYFVQLIAGAVIVVCVVVGFFLVNASAKQNWKFLQGDSTSGRASAASAENPPHARDDPRRTDVESSSR